jgi:glycosyltransferase involved in cell wall biosynthesis
LEFDYVDEPRLWALMAASDICVNLRWPTMGETSGTAIRALVLGRPLVVSDIGWFSELPDDAVAKVAAGPTEVEELTETLLHLGGDPELRQRLGASGEAHVRREHDLGKVAEAYTTALEESAGLELVRRDVLDQVSRAASDVGLTASSPELARVGKALSEVGLDD